MSKSFFFSVLLVAATGCAIMNSPEGGPKDAVPPQIINTSPPNKSIHFTATTIEIEFDEYVELKDFNNQFFASPPLQKRITQKLKGKKLILSINEALLPNTTYTFNFGNSINDITENNAQTDFKYVFSTGKFIDSLSIQGTIKDALELKPTATITVMLYEVNEKYEDSSIFKVNPNYIAFSLEKDSSFKIDNIKAGKYVLVALDDKSSNYRFDPKTEKIGFWNNAITVPNDSLFEINNKLQEIHSSLLIFLLLYNSCS